MDIASEQLIIDKIVDNGICNIDSFFEDKAIVSIEAIGTYNILKGYVFKKSELISFDNENNEKYIYFIYSKIPGKLYYYISDKEFSDLNKCKIDLI